MWGSLALSLALIAALIATVPSGITAQSGRRDAAIRTAQDNLQSAIETAEETYSLKPTFSRSEERTGEPDAQVRDSI